MEEIQISIEVIKNVFTEIFCEQYQKQGSLFKLHLKRQYYLLSALMQNSLHNNWIS